MSTQIYRKDFEKIYKDTYNKVLRFAVIKCRNLDDINDIIQDTYLELLKLLKKKNVRGGKYRKLYTWNIK